MPQPAKLTQRGRQKWRDFRAAAKLLSWYERNRRDLPWRRSSDPYAILVSEIMLQQTRVEVAEPYYMRFLARFPDVDALARAPLDQVLATWSGLGYYRRARHLHAAAQEIVAAGGELPKTVEGLRRLPGVGPYTSAAVASIAFGVATPAVDGNAQRVVARWRGIRDAADNAPARRRLAELASGLLDPERPGDSNQAVMELGAVVCRPQNPRCGECPLAGSCVAVESGSPESFRATGVRQTLARVDLEVALVSAGDRTLFFRRPAEAALLPGFWELPWAETRTTGSTAKKLAKRYGGRWRLGSAIGAVRHSITYRDLRVTIKRALLEGADDLAESRKAAWLAPDELSQRPVSSLIWKALAVRDRSPAGC